MRRVVDLTVYVLLPSINVFGLTSKVGLIRNCFKGYNKVRFGEPFVRDVDIIVLLYTLLRLPEP